jgi:hypothetical protein
MEKRRFRCCNCKKLRVAQVKGQRYCSEKACQQSRKNAWNQQKYASDADYRANQKESTQAWLASVGGSARYHREYRKRRKQGRGRKEKPPSRQDRQAERSLFAIEGKEAERSANRDAILDNSPIKTRRYLLFPVGSVNRDAILVDLAEISLG